MRTLPGVSWGQQEEGLGLPVWVQSLAGGEPRGGKRGKSRAAVSKQTCANGPGTRFSGDPKPQAVRSLVGETDTKGQSSKQGVNYR